MPHYFDQVFVFMALTFCSSLIISYAVLTAIFKSNKNYLPLLHVKAGKSQSHAFLLGGLALSASALITITSLLFYFSPTLSSVEALILKSSIFPIFLISLYGFLDDKYEIRARHKLFLQIFSVFSFIMPMCASLYQNNPYLLGGSFIFGLAYINGSNLIDGLDTIFAKVGTVISLGFFFLSVYVASVPSMAISILTIGSLAAFYYYNREPAKIYIGEIGGSLLGMLFYIQGHLIVGKMSSMRTEESPSTLDLIAKILIVSIYPLSELGITFFRRIFFKQSPFRGDHLHIHHIVKNQFSLNASKTANMISSIIVITMVIGFLSCNVTSPFIAFLVAVATISAIYSKVCYKHWKNLYSKENTNEIFFNLNEKFIHIIDGRAIDSLYSEYQLSDVSDNDDAVA